MQSMGGNTLESSASYGQVTLKVLSPEPTSVGINITSVFDSLKSPPKLIYRYQQMFFGKKIN